MASFAMKKKDVLPKEYSTRDIEIDSDPLISDDLFASLLNYKREIIISGKILKYTFSGLLITDVQNSASLERYVDSNDLYYSIPDPTSLPTGLTRATDDIFRFVNPYIYYMPRKNPCTYVKVDLPTLILEDDGTITFTGEPFTGNNVITGQDGNLYQNLGGPFGFPCDDFNSNSGGGYTPRNRW